MKPTVKFLLGIIGSLICLAGVISWGNYHRTNWSAIPPESVTGPNAVSSLAEARTYHLKTSATVEQSFPNPDPSATDEELLFMARKVVADSPQSAIVWARSQNDSSLQRRLLSAVIQAWGETDPVSAVDWVLVQDDSERRIDMEAALTGAVKQPQQALSIVRSLLKYYDPADGTFAAPALVVALNNAGRFQAALEFINDGPRDSRDDWLKSTFARWARSQPEDAAKALASIPDGALRAQVFQIFADNWAASDPSALASYAASLPDGQNRTYALNKSIDSWSLQDPAAMAYWLNTSPDGVDFDQAVATLISKTDSVNCSPEVALQWVGNIFDPKLKYDTMTLVLNQWNQADPAAAQNYAANVSWLDEQKRQDLLKSLQNLPLNSTTGGNE